MLMWLLIVARASACAPNAEWRSFRARLAGSTPSAGSTLNNRALKQEDEQVWREHCGSDLFWAHETSLPESGGLLLALPLQAQLLRGVRLGTSAHWCDALRATLEQGEDAAGGALGRWLESPNAPQLPAASDNAHCAVLRW